MCQRRLCSGHRSRVCGNYFSSCALALSYVPEPTQRAFPELFSQTFSEFRRLADESNSRYFRLESALANQIIPDLWKNRTVMTSWLEAGLPFPKLSWLSDRSALKVWKDDPEIYLLVATNCRRDLKKTGFQTASKKLRGDKEFMLQAVKQDARLFLSAEDPLPNDKDLAVQAFASSQYFVESYLLETHNTPFVDQVRVHVQEKLKAHATFHTALCGMSLANDSTSCALALLNQESDPSGSYKKLIAEYLDAPIGKELQVLKQASENLPVFFR